MSTADRNKWDQRYREGAYATRDYPSEFLKQRLLHLKRGKALDLACGAGRNSIFLAQNGFFVDAVDVSSVGLERARERAETLGVSINWLNQDLLDGWKLPSESYSLIIMFRFVALELLPVLPEILERGGSLIIEEHLQWKGEAVSGPTNENFRVRPGELARIVDGLKVVYEYEGLVKEPDGALAALSQLHLIK